MKDKLNKAYKETPERFLYTVESALSETKLMKNKKRRPAPFRTIIAMLLVLVVLPSTVFGAVKLGGAIAQRVGLFGVSFNININEDAPKYVKMSVDIPDGFKEQANSSGLKFDRDTEEWNFGFSILPMRFYESVDYSALETDVKEYNKTTIASRPSYELTGTDDYHGLARYYVWYEEANVLVLIYRGDTVTDDELNTFVDSISFTEGTESDHTTFFEPENDISQITNDTMLYEYEKEFVEMPVDIEIVFAGYSEQIGEGGLEVKASISDIRITDNINGIEKADLAPMFRTDELVDANGKLLPKDVEIWQNGDGINTETKLISCESMNQSLVLIDIRYENTTDKELEVYIPYRLETLTNEHGSFVPTTLIDKNENIAAREHCDTEVFYMSCHGESDKDFYSIMLDANEAKTVTLGFRCVDEQLENAYIVINPSTDGVITEDYTYSSNTYMIFKVQ